MLSDFDAVHQLRERNIMVGYWPFWFAARPVPDFCFPDAVEQSRCRQIEDAIKTRERTQIEAWLTAGYNLWYATFVDYDFEGKYNAMAQQRPDYRLFNGVIGGLGANSNVLVADIPTVMANALRSFAAELGTGRPVILIVNGPPITAQTGGAFCEADICPSDFRNAFEQLEAALDTALTHLTPAQFHGFGVALFDGAHFDIRTPHESFGSFTLNRVGETGYNHPILNLYRAR